MNELDIAWDQAIADAANYLEANPWDKKNDSIDYFFCYNGKCYPPKEVYKKASEFMLVKNPEEKISNLKGGEDTNIFLRKYGYEVGGKELTQTATKQFQLFLCNLQNTLNSRPNQRRFKINKKAQTSYFAWVSDPENKIGSLYAHYELIRRKKNGRKVYLEVHFEDQKIEVKQLLKLDDAGVIKDIDHDGWPAIQYGQPYDIYLPDTINDVINALNEVDEILGHELRKMINKNTPLVNIETERNQILYGPPGTGKTYRTIDEALRIVEPKFYQNVIESEGSDEEKRKQLTCRFKELLIKDWENPGEGKIVFTTFHQSLSYEDFIEGIKPQKDESSNDVYYEIQDGIFKRLCILAGKQRSAGDFEEAYTKFSEEVLEKGTIEFKTSVRNVKFNVEINSNHTAVVIPKSGKTRMSVTKNMIKEYLLTGEIRDWKPYLPVISNYIQNTYNVKVESINNLDNKYVIIMDEINRGNVSSIFGELITLIEPSKRKDREEELEVFLPYSKKPFSVPDNVYLIGTMNTADRSVEALDTALRRRFSFIEMMPESSVLPVLREGLNLKNMLTRINIRLAKLIDKDHQIGHAYMIGIESHEQLISCFKNKILPLLSEYFYGETGKIGLVLGNSFLEREDSDVEFADFDGYSESEIADLDAKISYKLSSSDEWQFQLI